MQIDVIPSVNEARTEDFLGKTTIVIDVLRATSTICTALEHGSAGVIPVETVCQAKQLQSKDELLGGERYCKKITGFDLGNSPFEYMGPDMRDKTIIMTTTNGTRAIYKAQKAAHVLAGCILNAPSCAKAAIHFKKDISILCAGTHDKFSLEDGLCAGFIVDELIKQAGDQTHEINDYAIAMQSTFFQHKQQMAEALLGCSNGRKFTKLGLVEDVHFCAQMGAYSVVPVLKGSTMKAYQSSVSF
jgi:2-phosphosulfolactate phosphatase